VAIQISPWGNVQFFTQNGAPAVGYKIFTYLAGTSQKEPVVANIDGTANHTNPILLDANGTAPLSIFLQSDRSYKFVFTTPNDTDPPATPIRTLDDVRIGIGDDVEPAVEWIVGTAPTFVNFDTFTVDNDQTALYHVGRRVKLESPLGIKYGTISASDFGSVTTVEVIMDLGVLDIGLNKVSYGFISALGSSWPSGFNTGLATSFNGPLFVPPTSRFNLIPAGLFFPFGGSVLPAGYLWCDGAAKSRTQFPNLFGAIGTTFGPGDGSTTFNVPDLRGRMPLGKDNLGGTVAGRVTAASLGGANAINLGGTGGAEMHTLTLAQMPAHTHGGQTYIPLLNSDEAGATNNTSVKRSDFATRSAGGGAAHNNMPPWLAVNYIIRFA
jgi:microcystin-dependent protein